MGEVNRKRRKDTSSDFIPRKRGCIDEFFVESTSAEAVLQRFHDAVKDLQIECVSPLKLKTITQRIRKLNKRHLHFDLTRPELLKVIKTLLNFVKTNASEEIQLSDENNMTKWADNVEMTLESCFVCFLMFAKAKNFLADFEEYVNEAVSLFASSCHQMNSHLVKTRGTNKIRQKLSAVKDVLIEDLNLLGEIVKVHDLNSINMCELITLCIQEILHQRDLEIQMSALQTVQIVYVKGEELRAATVSSILKSVGAVHEHYKFSKNFKINDSVSVSVFTVLVTSLVENAPIATLLARKSSDKSATLLRESFEGVMKVGCFVVMQFMRKIATCESGFRSYSLFLHQLASELIELSDEPEWPAAKLMLNLLAKPLTELVRLKPKPEPALRVLSVTILSEIIEKKIVDRKAYGDTLDRLQDRFPEEDFVQLARRLVIYHLTIGHRNRGNSALLHVTQWYEAIKHEIDAEEKATDILQLLTESDLRDCDAVNLTKHELNAITYFLDTARYGYADHRALIKYLLCSCYDRNKKVRTHAVRYLLELINLDVELLSMTAVSKAAFDCLTESVDKEKLWTLVGRFLVNHPERYDDYIPIFVRFPEEESSSVKAICVDIVVNLLRNYPRFRCDLTLSRKILGFLDDYVARERVIHFCTELWFAGVDNISLLLELVDLPRSAKQLRRVFEEKLKTDDDATEPIRDIVSKLLKRITTGSDEKTLQCLRVVSMLVMSRPRVFESDVAAIAGILQRETYSDNNAVEILTAEILNCVIPNISGPDVLVFVTLRTHLVERLTSNASLDYSMGLVVSLLKLIGNLSRFDPSYLLETCFRPSVTILDDYARCGRIKDGRVVRRALCLAVYLHPRFPNESDDLHFPRLLSHFIRHSLFGLVTVHSLCYLSVDHKLIMRRDVVVDTIRRYLADESNSLLVSAALHNITCSLKNIQKGELIGEGFDRDEQVDAVKNLARRHFKDIVRYGIDERPNIRQTVYSLIGQLLVSGLVPERHLVPSVLLACSDPVDGLSDAATELLSLLRSKSLFEHCRDSSAWILSSFRFGLKCSAGESIRGYRNRSGHPEAICNHVYVRVREEVTPRRQIVDSIMDGLTRDSETAVPEKLYLADHLATFSYRYQEEVYYVVREIETAISACEVPDRVVDTEDFVRRYYGVNVLHHVGEYLMSRYGFGKDRLRKYYQEDGRRDLAEARRDVSYHVPDYLLSGREALLRSVDVIHQSLKENRRKRFENVDFNT